MQVQAELVRRRNVHATKSGKKRCFSGNNCFSQIVCCGECDELYRRIHWNNRGKKSIVWRCISRLEPSSAEENCTNRTVSEDLLKEISTKGINRLCADSDSFIRQIQENVAKAVMNTDSLSPEGLDKRLEELQKELIDKANSKQDYDAIADEIFRLRNQKQQSQMDAETQKENLKRIKELQNFIANQSTEITEFDESLVRRLVEKITVFPDHFTVEFRSGVTVDIKA
jgi:site-specific DNA recombinase